LCTMRCPNGACTVISSGKMALDRHLKECEYQKIGCDKCSWSHIRKFLPNHVCPGALVDPVDAFKVINGTVKVIKRSDMGTQWVVPMNAVIQICLFGIYGGMNISYTDSTGSTRICGFVPHSVTIRYGNPRNSEEMFVREFFPHSTDRDRIAVIEDSIASHDGLQYAVLDVPENFVIDLVSDENE